MAGHLDVLTASPLVLAFARQSPGTRTFFVRCPRDTRLQIPFETLRLAGAGAKLTCRLACRREPDAPFLPHLQHVPLLPPPCACRRHVTTTTIIVIFTFTTTQPSAAQWHFPFRPASSSTQRDCNQRAAPLPPAMCTSANSCTLGYFRYPGQPCTRCLQLASASAPRECVRSVATHTHTPSAHGPVSSPAALPTQASDAAVCTSSGPYMRPLPRPLR